MELIFIFLSLAVIHKLELLIKNYSPCVILRPTKFWEVVALQQNPIVLRVKKGLFMRRYFYIFQYQGVCFQTDIGGYNSDRPNDVKIIDMDGL
jgi:hypothetical protein